MIKDLDYYKCYLSPTTTPHLQSKGQKTSHAVEHKGRMWALGQQIKTKTYRICHFIVALFSKKWEWINNRYVIKQIEKDIVDIKKSGQKEDLTERIINLHNVCDYLKNVTVSDYNDLLSIEVIEEDLDEIEKPDVPTEHQPQPDVQEIVLSETLKPDVQDETVVSETPKPDVQEIVLSETPKPDVQDETVVSEPPKPDVQETVLSEPPKSLESSLIEDQQEPEIEPGTNQESRMVPPAEISELQSAPHSVEIQSEPKPKPLPVEKHIPETAAITQDKDVVIPHVVESLVPQTLEAKKEKVGEKITQFVKNINDHLSTTQLKSLSSLNYGEMSQQELRDKLTDLNEALSPNENDEIDDEYDRLFDQLKAIENEINSL